MGDRSITLGDFVSAIEHMDQFDRVRYQAPEERRKELLNEMIDVMLLADEAREQGVRPGPHDRSKKVREILRDALLKKARAGLPGPSEISADEVSAYYDAHKADFHDPERRRVSAIVLGSQPAADAALAAVNAGTSQFGDLVRSKSVDPQAKANVPVDLAGDLGFVSPPGDVPRAVRMLSVPDKVRAAAFQIGKVGDVFPSVVKSGTKFYVVKLGSKTDPHDRTLKDAERSIRVRLSQDKIHAKEESAIDEKASPAVPREDRRAGPLHGAGRPPVRRRRRRRALKVRQAAMSQLVPGSALVQRGSEAQAWSDWRWQLRHAVSSVVELARAVPLTSGELEGARRAERQGLPLRITPYYLSLVDRNDPACPIRRQCVPDAREGEEVPGDLVDPLGEVAHQVAPHLVQRYPDRVLLLATDRCAVYCRFCTRSRMVGNGDGAVSLEALGPALDWLHANPAVRDVIVSGGDPLAMATDRIVRLVAAVRGVPRASRR